MSLAREFGIPVRELLSRMDSRELSEWMAFYRLEYKRAKQTPLEEEPDNVNEKIKKALLPFKGT